MVFESKSFGMKRFMMKLGYKIFLVQLGLGYEIIYPFVGRGLGYEIIFIWMSWAMKYFRLLHVGL